MLEQYIHAKEGKKVLSFIGKVSNQHSRPIKILDVGCGYGTYLAPLQKLGHQITGIDVNPAIVEENKRNGLSCLTPKEFSEMGNQQFDLVMFAHVVEHFAPDALIQFLDNYLDSLKVKGHVLIATPLMSAHFFDDFDHVKPYQPTAICLVFGEKPHQVQYQSRNKLKLSELWYRKDFLRIHHSRGRYFKNVSRAMILILDKLSIVFYLLTFGLVGETSGWVGMFRKEK